MESGAASLFAPSCQLACVVRVSAADDHDGFDLIDQAFEGGLMIFGGMADCVDETDVRVWIKSSNFRDDRVGVSRGRRRLTHDAETRIRKKPYIAFVGENIESVKIFDDSLHLDVAGFADHEDVIAGGLKFLGGVMSAGHERASRIEQRFAGFD